MTISFWTDVTLRVEVTAVTEPRDGGRFEVIGLSRVVTETGGDVLEAMPITDRIALAQEAEVAAQLTERKTA